MGAHLYKSVHLQYSAVDYNITQPRVLYEPYLIYVDRFISCVYCVALSHPVTNLCRSVLFCSQTVKLCIAIILTL